MTKEALEIEPGKPFAAAVITIRVKIPEKTDTAVLSLSGDGDSIIMLEK
ncbi:MAG: hypothetical protein JW881_13190 [Spirochaetales bacterium]|nr:hypothetical protein [Spirochaetales bacterium]